MISLRLDALGGFFIIAAIMILIYSSTFPSTMNLSMLNMVLLVTGISGALLFHTLQVSGSIDLKAVEYGLMVAVVVIISNIMIVNIKYYSQVPPINLGLFMILVAVAEETAIRGFLMPVFISKIGVWPGIILSSASWMIYHWYVSSGNPVFLTTIFLAGLILGYIDIMTKSLTPSLLAHVLNNLLVII